MNKEMPHKKYKKIYIIYGVLFLWSAFAHCFSPMDSEGNVNLLDLPGPLFGFGQNIIPKNNIFLSSIIYQLKGNNGLEGTELWFPRILYGIRDDLSLTLTVPIALKFAEQNYCSSGLEDIRVSLEYEFFQKKFDEKLFRTTILGSVFLPTSSIDKNPPTGFGGTSFFMGPTMAYFTQEWYAYNSDFVHITTQKNNIKFGNRFLYQAGIGRNFSLFERGLLSLIVEFAGFWEQRDTIDCVVNPNSGGNMLFCGPTVYIAADPFYVQGGIIFPIVQRLNGEQPKSSHIWGLFMGIRI